MIYFVLFLITLQLGAAWIGCFASIICIMREESCIPVYGRVGLSFR